MPIIERQGDLLSADMDFIAHGCNCFNTMGGGIARAIKNKYPRAYEADCRTIKGDSSKLGTFTYSTTETGPAIFNLYTQYKYGTDQMQLSYAALAQALFAMKDFMEVLDPDHRFKIGFPRIGCGLAGGNWKQVKEMLEMVFDNRTVYVYTL